MAKKKTVFIPKAKAQQQPVGNKKQSATPNEQTVVQTPEPTITPEKKIKIPEWVKWLAGAIVGAFIGAVITVWWTDLKNTPKISVITNGFTELIPPGPPGRVDYLVYILPAKIFNNGDKTYWVRDIKFEILIGSEWVRLYKTTMMNASIVNLGSDNTAIEIDPSVSDLDSVFNIQPNTAIRGRFLFRPNKHVVSLNLDRNKAYNYRLTLIDFEGKNILVEGKTGAMKPTKGKVFDPDAGIRSIDFSDSTVP